MPKPEAHNYQEILRVLFITEFVPSANVLGVFFSRNASRVCTCIQ